MTSLTILAAQGLIAQGMWLPQRLDQRAEDMAANGLELNVNQIYSDDGTALNSAIVHFGGFCTGEIISGQGLVLTNHHCGYGQIQSHSTLENNYLKDGFWAKSQSEELPNPGLFVEFVVEMNDINYESSDDVKAATDAALAVAKAERPELNWRVESIYQGHQHILIGTIRYNDVRLVGAPPSAIGKYGADTDNWVFPRHTGDFSMFRVYAAPDGTPAEYSDDNVPLATPNHLKVSTKGLGTGDFTMIYGFPGRTTSYLPVAAVEDQLTEVLPARIAMRDAVLAVWDSAMRQDAQVKIDYSSKYARVSNGWKKWIGQIEGMEKVDGLSVLESKQLKVTKANPEAARQLKLEIEPLLDSMSALSLELTYYSEVLSHWELAKWSRELLTFEKALGSDKAASAWARMQKFDKEYNRQLDRNMSVKLVQAWQAGGAISASTQTMWDELSAFAGGMHQASLYDAIPAFPEGDYDAERAANYVEIAKEHPLSEIWVELLKHYRGLVASEAAQRQRYSNAYNEWIGNVMSVNPDMAPDANSTLRVAYGQVLPLQTSDAVTYHTHTTADGILQKYVPGDYEFDLPERVVELLEARDYGDYADEAGDLPVCFIAANHTSGGNSGSPALNAQGELVGLNFDRIWEGTMSDFYFTPERCRNIMVDIRYVLWVVDVYAEADHLIEEMDLR